jgi:hypothetical protein
MTAVIALHRALYYPGSLILCLAPALRQSQELFGKMPGFYRDLGRPVTPAAERRLSLELENGSRIVTLPGTDKTIRGFSGAALLIVDEASRVADELYFAVRPMLAVSGGALMMLTTPYGKRGVFYEGWMSGHGWEKYEVKASECPRITEEFLEEERQALPSWVYRQEYECSFEETEDTVFTYEMVQGAVTSEVTPLFEGGRDSNMPFLIGLDLGQSSDYTALSVIENVVTHNGKGEKQRTLHLRHLERYPLRTLYPDIADGVAALMKDPKLSPDVIYGGVRKPTSPILIVDQTGVGPAVTDLLKKKGLTFKAVQITGGHNVNYEDGSWRVPKRDLVGALEVYVHTGQLKVAEDLKLWPVLRDELLNFKRKISLKTGHDSYEHWRESDHDDLVLATALACWWLAYKTRPGRGRVRFIR